MKPLHALYTILALGGPVVTSLTGCGTDDPAPAPAPTTSTTTPVVPPGPPARTLSVDVPLGLSTDNLFADPQFLVPGFRPNAFFVFSPKIQSPKSTVRYAAWDTPFGRRSPAVTIGAQSEELVLCSTFPASKKGTYRVSIWISGTSPDGTETPLPEGASGEMVSAAGKKAIAKLTPTGEPKVVGTRSWTKLEGTFTTDPGNVMLLVTAPKGSSLLVAAPEAREVTAASASLSPVALGSPPAWVERAFASLPDVPRPKPQLPPRPTP